MSSVGPTSLEFDAGSRSLHTRTTESHTQPAFLDDPQGPPLFEGNDADSNLQDDDGLSIVLETSTIEYSQEPFESMKTKVLALMLEMFPNHTAPDFEIDWMPGGSFNRIIGVKVFKPKSRHTTLFGYWIRTVCGCFGVRKFRPAIPAQDLILRIPRHSENIQSMEEIYYEVSTLKYLALCLPFPVPQVTHYDKSPNNPLGLPYMIQKRLPGKPLHEVFDAKMLTKEQMVSIGQQVIQIALDISEVKHGYASTISHPGNELTDVPGPVKLETIPVPVDECSGTLSAQPQTTKEFLVSQINRWKEKERNRVDCNNNPTCADWRLDIWDDLEKIVRKLHGLGFLPDEDRFHLCHMDFQARNILVKITEREKIEVTGVLDWDSALFGPKFVAKRAPFWLWDGEGGDELDEYGARATPSPEDKVFKDIFEEMADEEFLDYAYKSEYIIARRLFYILRTGIFSSTLVRIAEGIISDFENLYPF